MNGSSPNNNSKPFSDFNKVEFTGRMGSDPNVRYTPSGAMIAECRIATREGWNDKSGEAKERTSWITVSVMNNEKAQDVAKNFKKGDWVRVEGKLREDTWNDKTTGEKRSKLVVMAHAITLAKKQQSGMAPAQSKPAASAMI